MGRIARSDLLYEGCYAHVFSRAIEKWPVFDKPEDFEEFKRALKRAKAEYGFKVFHYCVMHTHFHLVVEISNVVRFSKGMKAVKKAYAQWYNQKQKRFGPIWRDRFKCKLIENEQYLSVCGKYVEDNPVRAGLVEQSADWAYSSSRYYQSGEEDWIIDSYSGGEGKIGEMTDTIDFEKTVAIGSEWFQFQIARKLKG